MPGCEDAQHPPFLIESRLSQLDERLNERYCRVPEDRAANSQQTSV